MLHEWRFWTTCNSPNLTQSDFLLFGPLKEHLACKQIRNDDNLQHADVSWIKALDTDFLSQDRYLSVMVGQMLKQVTTMWKRDVYQSLLT